MTNTDVNGNVNQISFTRIDSPLWWILSTTVGFAIGFGWLTNGFTVFDPSAFGRGGVGMIVMSPIMFIAVLWCLYICHRQPKQINIDCSNSTVQVDDKKFSVSDFKSFKIVVNKKPSVPTCDIRFEFNGSLKGFTLSGFHYSYPDNNNKLRAFITEIEPFDLK